MDTFNKFLVGAVFLFCQPVLAQVTVGPYVGTGLAPTANAGALILFKGPFGVDLGYSTGVIARRCSDFKLTIKHVSALYRPFFGSFYLGAGAGQNDLTVLNTYEPTKTDFSIEASATLLSYRGGWLWGLGNGGFWSGFDFAKYQAISSNKEINAPGVDQASQDFADAADPVERFTQSYFYTIMLRIGWMI